MTITEIAEKYANRNSEQDLKAAIIEAYVEGHNNGYYQAMALPKRPKVRIDFNFLDMGLPSGTQWASCFIRFDLGGPYKMNYKEAQRYQLPTKEQCEELFRHCKLTAYKYGVKIKAENGNEIDLETTAAEGSTDKDLICSVQFWMDCEIDSEQKASFQNISFKRNELLPSTSVESQLAWHDQTVLLVKTPKTKVNFYGYEFEV